ncbi:MAG: formylmethanofuran dehydrogenase subunit E family protein [Candidatus Omnitrophica bacterium]|nr:formylmethanofuran dehydrogenase subunit E family protein [Candidatus Omnitrophota bacterium]
MAKTISLQRAVDFHGHLGPYLVLGLLMGKLAVNELGAKRHFGLKVIVKGANEKPKSCLIDGLQLSTGCTYGKGNIQKIKGNSIQALFYNLENKKKIRISLNKDLIGKLNNLKGHKDSEIFAKKIFHQEPAGLFKKE